MVTTFKTSYLKTEALHENQKLQAIDKLQLKQDVCTRWNSAYYMIERVLAVYPAIYGALFESRNKDLLLSEDDLDLLPKVIEMLKPFEKATRKFSAKKVPTSGLVLPYLQNFFYSQLQPKETNHTVIKRAKNLIHADLLKRYTKPEQKLLLGMCSVLDPRVRTLDWMSQEDKDVIYEELKREALRVALGSSMTSIKVKVEPGEDEPSVSSACSLAPPPPKIPKLESSDSDDDLDGVIIIKEEGPKPVDVRVDAEIAQYKSEPSLGLKFPDVLQWWVGNRVKYPILSNVMLRYMNIPATSVPSERVFSTAGEVFDGREALTPDNANMLIFLYHN